MAYKLFEFISCMFSRPRYANCTDADKKEHFFMTMRTISTLYPLEINNYNVKGINEVAVLDYWHFILTSKFKSQPRNLFVTTKKADKTKSKVSKFKKDTVKLYLRVNQMDERDFDFLASINEDYICLQLKDIEKDLKESKDYFNNF